MRKGSLLRGKTATVYFRDSLAALGQLDTKLCSWLRFNTAKGIVQEQKNKDTRRSKLESSHPSSRVTLAADLGDT